MIFFLLTFGCFWLAAPLAVTSVALPGLVASFAPAIAAFLLTAILSGKPGTRMLARKLLIWQVGLSWYGAAIGIPIIASLIVALTSFFLGAGPTLQVGAIVAYIPAIFILAAGEEFGWRGFVLPQLLGRLPALGVAVILGVIHAAYHLPLWVAPGFPPPSYSLLAFLVSSLAFGVIWTWLYQNTKGSVLLATLFHGSINSAGNIFFAGIPSAQLSWVMPLVFCLAAIGVIVWSGPTLTRRQSNPSATGQQGRDFSPDTGQARKSTTIRREE